MVGSVRAHRLHLVLARARPCDVRVAVLNGGTVTFFYRLVACAWVRALLDSLGAVELSDWRREQFARHDSEQHP